MGTVWDLRNVELGVQDVNYTESSTRPPPHNPSYLQGVPKVYLLLRNHLLFFPQAWELWSVLAAFSRPPRGKPVAQRLGI